MTKLFSLISKNFDLSKYTNVTYEMVYSPTNPRLDELFTIVGGLVAPFLKWASVANSSELVPRLSQSNSFVGVEFPDSYAVSS